MKLNSIYCNQFAFYKTIESKSNITWMITNCLSCTFCTILQYFCVKDAKLIHLTREAPFFVYANAQMMSAFKVGQMECNDVVYIIVI